jgi:prevent-host-death family protein
MVEVDHPAQVRHGPVPKGTFRAGTLASMAIWRGWRGVARQARQTRRAMRARSSATDSLTQYNVTDARNLFSQLLKRVRDGEVIVIAFAGEPVAKLSPYRGPVVRPGVIRAHVVVHDATPEGS